MRGLALVLACVAISAPLFAPVLGGQSQFFYRDVTRQYEPTQRQLQRAWADGEVPTWNERTQSGVPLLANLHAGALAPWTPVFAWLPFARAYGLVSWAAWAALVAGVYALLRGRLRAGAAAMGALCLGFSGVVLGATSYLPFLAGAACIPWQLVLLHRARGPSRLAGLAVLFALQVLCGDPSTALMGALACFLFVALTDVPTSTPSLLLAGLVALGLSAVQLLPAWMLYEESARAASTLDARLAWSFHPARALEWVLRLPYGGLLAPPYFDRYALAAGPDAQPFFLEHGWGLSALLLLGPALVARGRLRRVGLALVCAGFVLSLGTFLGPARALFELPPLSMFRFPERYGLLCALGASLLVAHGAHALGSDATSRRRWAWGWLACGVVLASLGLGVEGALREACRTAAVFGFAAGALAVFTSRAPWAWATVLLGLVFGEGLLAARASLLTIPAEPLPAVAAPSGTGRLWRENAPLRALERVVRGSEDLAAERRLLHATFASATPGLHGVTELGGFSPVVLKRWQRVIQATAGRPALLASLFDVCWFVSTRERGLQQPGWTPVRVLAPEVVLFETRDCRGRAWTVGRTLEVSDTEAAVQALTGPGFDPANTAVREGSEALPPLGMTRVEPKPRVSASTVELSVTPVEAWVLVVLSESWAPGWRVFVDGDERPVERLDGALLGVAVPPGGREVQFRYEEPLLATGLGVSLATGLVLVLLAVRGRRQRSTG